MSEKISKALIFDSVYDPYKWVVIYVKVVAWSFTIGKNVHLIHSDTNIMPTELGYFDPDYHKDKILSQGQIWYIVTGLKSVRDAQIWDTVIVIDKKNTDDTEKLQQYIIPGFKKTKPFIYAGVFPIETTEYDKLKESLAKLSLNDSAIEYDMEDSKALGLGFRCGFLWMLHMDIIKERLSREYDLETIFTTPTVVYLVKSKQLNLDSIKSWKNMKELLKTGYFTHVLKYELPEEEYKHLIPTLQNTENGMLSEIELMIMDKYEEILKPRMVVRSGSDMIPQGMVDEIMEPFSEIEIVGPNDFAGEIMGLCQEYRWNMVHMDYLDQNRVVWKYLMPMGEVIIDFYDKLKSKTKGYATMNYEFKKYIPSDLVKLDIFVNNEVIEALSWIVHKDKSYYFGREIVKKLKTLIPKHLFAIPIQAGIGNKMIARENISAMRKDVISKCYGGDVTRKRKLLEKQKEGKKKMKAMGSVSVPSDLFMKLVARE